MFWEGNRLFVVSHLYIFAGRLFVIHVLECRPIVQTMRNISSTKNSYNHELFIPSFKRVLTFRKCMRGEGCAFFVKSCELKKGFEGCMT